MLCWNIFIYLFYLRSYFILLLWDRTCISKVIKNYRLPTVIFPDNSVGKESACNVGDLGSIPGSRRSPGEGNSNPLQYSCLENSMDRETWWGTVHGAASVGHDLATKPPVGQWFNTHAHLHQGSLYWSQWPQGQFLGSATMVEAAASLTLTLFCAMVLEVFLRA